MRVVYRCDLVVNPGSGIREPNQKQLMASGTVGFIIFGGESESRSVTVGVAPTAGQPLGVFPNVL